MDQNLTGADRAGKLCGLFLIDVTMAFRVGIFPDSIKPL
jgi:hypothetical protein